MTALVKIWKDHLLALHEDETGAAMIEYSVLIGMITVLIILLVAFVGEWIGERWTDLATTLAGSAPAPIAAP